MKYHRSLCYSTRLDRSLWVTVQAARLSSYYHHRVSVAETKDILENVDRKIIFSLTSTLNQSNTHSRISVIKCWGDLFVIFCLMLFKKKIMWNNWVLYYTISICISCKILDLAHGAMMEFHFGPLREKVWAPPIYMMSSMCALTALLAPPCPELELIFWTQTHHRKKSAPVTRVSDDNNTGKSYLYRVRMFAFSLESQKDKVRKITVFHGLFERGFSLLPTYSHWWNDVTENGKTKTRVFRETIKFKVQLSRYEGAQ